MPIQHVNWIPLNEAITDYLTESEQSNHKFFKLWHLAFRAMSELGMDFFYTVKTIKLPVSDTLTVRLPSDFISYSKVGVFNEQGEIITMGVNSKLSTGFDIQPSRLTKTVDRTVPTQLTDQGVWWFNYWNGYAFGPLYGLPSNTPFIGSFKIDNANGVIVLNPTFSYPYLALEYISSPREDQEYYIPIQFKEAIIAYLRWKDIISMPVKTHVANANAAMRRREYFNERRLAIARFDPINLPDLYEWGLQNQRLAIKT